MYSPDTDGMGRWRFLAVFVPPEFAWMAGQWELAARARAITSGIDPRQDGATDPEPPAREKRSLMKVPAISWIKKRTTAAANAQSQAATEAGQFEQANTAPSAWLGEM